MRHTLLCVLSQGVGKKLNVFPSPMDNDILLLDYSILLPAPLDTLCKWNSGVRMILLEPFFPPVTVLIDLLHGEQYDGLTLCCPCSETELDCVCVWSPSPFATERSHCHWQVIARWTNDPCQPPGQQDELRLTS